MNYIQIAKTYCRNVVAFSTVLMLVSCGGGGGGGGGSVSTTPPAIQPGNGRFNDTGLTASQCYQAGSDILVACSSANALALNNAQDGMIGRDAYTATNSNTDGKLGFSYSSVPPSGTDPGGCVKDNITGLTWEVKTTNGGVRDWNNTYDTTTASNFVTAVNSSALCGYSNWRLPTPDELQHLVDYSVTSPGPTIDTTWFPNTKGSLFWSALAYAGNPTAETWGVDFANGSLSGFHPNSELHYVRLVRP